MRPPEGRGRDMPPEFNRLSKREQRFALRRYVRWMGLTTESGHTSEDQRLQAINVGYISVAQLWLAVGGPIGFAAGCMWSFPDSTTQISIALILTALAAGPLAFMIIRWRQAHRYWPGVVRLPGGTARR